MRTFTLDTSAVIAGACPEHDGPYVDTLVRLAQEGRIDLAVTTAFDLDQQTATSDQGRRNLAYLAQLPRLDRLPGPARFSAEPGGFDDVQWPFVGPDAVVTSDEVAAVDEKVREIVVRSMSKRTRRHQWIDSHHLVTHFHHRRDYFVTKDVDDMLKFVNELKRLGIAVKSLPEAADIATAVSSEGTSGPLC